MFPAIKIPFEKPVPSASSAPKISYFPATLYAYNSGGKVKLQMKVQDPDNINSDNNSIFVKLYGLEKNLKSK